MLLVTGFEPFGGLAHNPSQAILALLPEALGGVPLRKALLPVDTEKVGGSFRSCMRKGPGRCSIWDLPRAGPFFPWSAWRSISWTLNAPTTGGKGFRIPR